MSHFEKIWLFKTLLKLVNNITLKTRFLLPDSTSITSL